MREVYSASALMERDENLGRLEPGEISPPRDVCGDPHLTQRDSIAQEGLRVHSGF